MVSDADAATAQRALDRTFLSGIAWSGVARFGAQMISWVVTFYVAHLLEPRHYGLVVAASLATSLVRLLAEFGIGTAIVIQRDIESREVSQLGGLSLLMAGAAFAICTVFSVPLARFVGSPASAALIPVLALSSALSIAGTVPVALLQRRLKFKRLSQLELLRSAVGSLVIVWLAQAGFEQWSLVFNELCAAIVFTLGVYLSAKHAIAWPRFADVRRSVRVSAQLLVERTSWWVFSNADFFVVSRRLGPKILGDYTMAWTLMTMPGDKIAAALFGVTTGVFSSVQKATEELTRYFLLATRWLAALLLPAALGLALVVGDFTEAVLGTEWLGIIPLAQALALYSALHAIDPIATQVLVARLRTKTAAALSLTGAVAMPVAFFAASRYGAVGVALAWSILYPMLTVAKFGIASRELGMPMRRVFQSVVPPLVGCAGMAAVMLALRPALVAMGAGAMIRLPIMIALGATTYILIVLVPLRVEFRAFVALIRSR